MNNKSRYYVRVLAGAYLMYQGYNLIKAAMAEHIAIIFPIFGVTFLALGVAIGGSGLMTLHKMNKEEQENGGAVKMPETEKEEVSEVPEISESLESSEISEGQESLENLENSEDSQK